MGWIQRDAHPPNFAQSKFWLWSTLNHSRWRRSGLAQFTPEPQTAKRLYIYLYIYSIYPDRQKILTSWNPASHQKLRLRRDNTENIACFLGTLLTIRKQSPPVAHCSDRWDQKDVLKWLDSNRELRTVSRKCGSAVWQGFRFCPSASSGEICSNCLFDDFRWNYADSSVNSDLYNYI